MKTHLARAILAALLLVTLSALQGCFYCTKFVNNIGKRTARVREVNEVRYGVNGDLALQVNIEHRDSRTIDTGRKGNTTNETINYIIIPQKIMSEEIVLGVKPEHRTTRRNYDPYPNNSLIIKPKLSLQKTGHSAYILTDPFSNHDSPWELLPNGFEQNVYTLNNEGIKKGYFYKNKNNSSIYYKYQIGNNEYFITNTYKYEERWLTRLWWGYPLQIFKFGPSQLLDIITSPFQYFIAIGQFNDSFN